MTNQRRINRSQGTINDSQSTINDEQAILNDRTKIDLSIGGFWGLLVLFSSLITGACIIYFGLTNQIALLSRDVKETNQLMVDHLVTSHAQSEALNKMETRVTTLEVKINDGSSQLKVQ